MSSSLCKGSVLVLFFLQTEHISVHPFSFDFIFAFHVSVYIFPNFFIWITVKQELQSSPPVQLYSIRTKSSAVTDFTRMFFTLLHI